MKTAGEWREEARRRFLRDVVINYPSAHACGTIQDAWDWAIRAAQEEMREEAAALMESGSFCRAVEEPNVCECEERAAAIREIEVK